MAGSSSLFEHDLPEGFHYRDNVITNAEERALLDAIAHIAFADFDDAHAYCRVNGTIAPVDASSTSRPFNFSVALSASWSGRAAQLGGGGMNGVIPNLTSGPGATSLLPRGFVTCGSDSGHQASFGRRGGPPPAGGVSDDWAPNEEAIANLGYMQMKKTHDAAMVIIES